MSDETMLGDLARRALQARRLPERCPDRTWGGPGTGVRCAICGSAVQAEEMEYELEFAAAGGRDESRYHVHVRCFAAWDRERQRRALRERSACVACSSTSTRDELR